MSFPDHLSAFTPYRYAPVFTPLEPSRIRNVKLRSKAPSDPIDIPQPEPDKEREAFEAMPPSAPTSRTPFGLIGFPKV